MKSLFAAFTALFIAFSANAQSVDLAASNLKWSGSDVTGKTHYGSLSFTKADLELNRGDLVGGAFEIDMTTLKVEDLTGEWAEKLVGHLSSDDFFSIDKFDKATLVLSDVSKMRDGAFHAKGDLTIKEITHPTEVHFTPNGKNGFNAAMTFNRAIYDVKFRSGSFFQNLGDKLILDDIKLEATIAF
jgi:polyisoprenoid-binding protein YceI